MKVASCIFVIVLVAARVSAQPFMSLRYDEHYSYLKDSVRLSWYQQMKYSRLSASGNSFVSFGGEVRYQYFRFRNEGWGDAAEDNDGFILNRLLLHADWHLNRRIRLFTQLQSSSAIGRAEPPSPVELNEMDMHQLFADAVLLQGEDHSLTLRAGRQEMNYGSSRLISPREGPNNRQAFDGFKLLLKKKRVKADVFFTRYVRSKKGIFNDQVFDKNTRFGGAYVVVTGTPILGNIDVYYLGIRKETAAWADVKGKELRHSLGSRIWGRTKRWSYDFEELFQFGDIAGSSIRAWTLSSSNSYQLGDNEKAPTIGLKTEMISGDKRPGDNRIESFNPLFPRGAYFGYAALIGPSNLFDIHPSIGVPLSSAVSVFADYDIFWRYSLHDGIYTPGVAMIYPAEDGTSKFIGHQVSGTLEYIPNPFLFIRVETTWFKAGDYLKSVGAGKNIYYFGVTTTFRF